MKLPPSFTTVTPLSKTIAMIVFVILPILGFFYGVRFQQRLNEPDPISQKTTVYNGKNLTPTPTPVIETDYSYTKGWKTYKNNKIGFEFKYPARLGRPFIPTNMDPPTYADGNETDVSMYLDGDTTSYSLYFSKFEGVAQDLYKREVNGSSPSDPQVFLWSPFVTGLNTNVLWYMNGVGEYLLASEDVYFVKKGYGFIFRSDDRDVLNFKEMQQILSTFYFYDWDREKEARESGPRLIILEPPPSSSSSHL